MGEMKNAYKILFGKMKGRDHSGRARHKWEDYIRMDLGEIW
jgi:hypothetical protein